MGRSRTRLSNVSCFYIEDAIHYHKTQDNNVSSTQIKKKKRQKKKRRQTMWRRHQVVILFVADTRSCFRTLAVVSDYDCC